MVGGAADLEAKGDGTIMNDGEFEARMGMQWDARGETPKRATRVPHEYLVTANTPATRESGAASMKRHRGAQPIKFSENGTKAALIASAYVRSSDTAPSDVLPVYILDIANPCGNCGVLLTVAASKPWREIPMRCKCGNLFHFDRWRALLPEAVEGIDFKMTTLDGSKIEQAKPLNPVDFWAGYLGLVRMMGETDAALEVRCSEEVVMPAAEPLTITPQPISIPFRSVISTRFILQPDHCYDEPVPSYVEMAFATNHIACLPVEPLVALLARAHFDLCQHGKALAIADNDETQLPRVLSVMWEKTELERRAFSEQWVREVVSKMPTTKP